MYVSFAQRIAKADRLICGNLTQRIDVSISTFRPFERYKGALLFHIGKKDAI